MKLLRTLFCLFCMLIVGQAAHSSAECTSILQRPTRWEVSTTMWDRLSEYAHGSQPTFSKTAVMSLNRFNVNQDLFYQTAKKSILGGNLIHAVRFPKLIEEFTLNQQVQPSYDPNNHTGSGVYATLIEDRTITLSYINGRRRALFSDKEIFVLLQIKRNARIVDISKGEGARIFKEYSSNYMGDNLYDDFAADFDIDIINYDWITYQSGEYAGEYHTPAYVIKNPNIILKIKKVRALPASRQRNG